MPEEPNPKSRPHPSKQQDEKFKTRRHHWTQAKESRADDDQLKWRQGWGGFKDEKERERQFLRENPDAAPKAAPDASQTTSPNILVRAGSEVPFAELCATSNFTFLTGASHPDEIAFRAAELGYRAVGVCDTNTLAGVVRCHVEAERQGMPQVIGSRIELDDGLGIYLWPTDLYSYGRLSTLLTVGKRRTTKGQCLLTLQDLLEHSAGSMAGIEVPTHIDDAFVEKLRRLKAWFNDDRLSLLMSRDFGGDDEQRLRHIARLGLEERIPLLATNRPLYHVPGRRLLQDTLTCIRHGCTLDEAGFDLEPSAERHMKVPEETARLFGHYPEAIARSVEVAERCRGFSLTQLRYQYPSEVVPAGESAMGHLTRLARAGYERRFTKDDPAPERVRQQFEHELVLIEELDLPHYFLTVDDLVRWTREQGILCQGRGAAANSIVCYTLGITDADPRKINTLFERFVSRVRNEPPDIDVDFEHERREEAIQYLYTKYGRHRAALTANVITYRGRSAVREVGKALGLSPDTIDQLAKSINWWKSGPVEDEELGAANLDQTDITTGHLLYLSQLIQGFPRHLSQHPGGFVLTETPLYELVPVENASMPDRTVIEWDKDDIDAMGFIKLDVLGLGMLTVLAKAVKLFVGDVDDFDDDSKPRVERSDTPDGPDGSGVSLRSTLGFEVTSEPEPVPDIFPRLARTEEDVQAQNAQTLATAPVITTTSSKRSRSNYNWSQPFPSHWAKLAELSAAPKHEPRDDLPPPIPTTFSKLLQSPEDPAVYDMICAADTLGTFQIESRAQMSMLPRLRPREFYDLVIEVAIVRPGPIQGGMVHPYLRRRSGEEPVPKPSGKAIDWILEKTLGVPLFQEQAMLMAVHCAGFTPDEADALRRAVTGFRRFGDIDSFEAKIVEGMVGNGYDRTFAERCFKQIQGFSTYGFPESHAASFAIIAYASCYLKHHWPDVFLAAMMNSQPLGFYQPAQLVQDAIRHDVEVLEVDVAHSSWDCTLHERDNHRWQSVRLGMRTVKGLRQDDADRIVAARRHYGRFKTLEQLWRLSGCSAHAIKCLAKADAFGSMGLDRQSAVWHAGKLRDDDAPLFEQTFEPQEPVKLPELAPLRHVLADYAHTGLSLKDHPMRLLREEGGVLRGVTLASDLADDKACPAGRGVTVAGICLVRQRPGSAKSITFITLEDESGMANLVVYPQTFDRFKRVARDARAMKVRGRIDRQGEVVHVIAVHFESIDDELHALRSLSRNFH